MLLQSTPQGESTHPVWFIYPPSKTPTSATLHRKPPPLIARATVSLARATSLSGTFTNTMLTPLPPRQCQ